MTVNRCEQWVFSDGRQRAAALWLLRSAITGIFVVVFCNTVGALAGFGFVTLAVIDGVKLCRAGQGEKSYFLASDDFKMPKKI